MKNERRVIVEIISTEKNARNKFAAPLDSSDPPCTFFTVAIFLSGPLKAPNNETDFAVHVRKRAKTYAHQNQLKRRCSLKSAGLKRPYVLE